jgi:hypothetical protein
MYYPQSQIKTNLYTNGEEYTLSTTNQFYKGYYFETSTGKKYTGKTPNDKPNILLLSTTQLNDVPFISGNPTENGIVISNSSEEDLNYSIIDFSNYLKKTDFTYRNLPTHIQLPPTQQDIEKGIFVRYFCKKNNELIYIETDKENYDLFSQQSPNVAWDLYTAKSVLWNIKGDKQKTYQTNKNIIALFEQKNQWYGFSQYLKEDFLKYYVEE